MENQKSIAAAIFGGLVALGLLGAGYFVSNTLYKAKFASNVVTVRGFAERDAKADLGTWQFSFSLTGDVLSEVYNKVSDSEKTVKKFLTDKGLKVEDIGTGKVAVTDLLADQYRSTPVTTGRYILKDTITVRTLQVDKIDEASRDLNTLIQQGIVLASNNVDYQFTKLNDVKTDMLREATQNARAAAQQFANDAGSKVGAIQSASQGYFSISSRDQSSDNSEGSAVERTSTIDKKVRVVVTLTYYLDR
ncbi:MAG: SIMPL domain-containing protein [Pseudomonadota bacterium]